MREALISMCQEILLCQIERRYAKLIKFQFILT